MVSTGEGVTTCSYVLPPAAERILDASTHLAGAACPPRPGYESGYVWPLHRGYDLFTARGDASDLLRLTSTPGYDAEATASRDGGRLVFTSVRDGDLELYTMDAAGGDVKRLTHEEGYEGGAFFSPEGSRTVYRARHPTEPEELAENADGPELERITTHPDFDAFPMFNSDGTELLWASNRNAGEAGETNVFVAEWREGG